MLYLTVAVIFASVLGLLNLLLVIGVIRRLREHTELLSQHSSGARRADLVMLAAGERIGEFEAAIEGGDTFSTAVLPQRLLAGFFTPWCDSCHERLPAFIELARSASWSRERVLAVVAADEADGAQLRGELAQVAQVVVAQDSELVIKAFGVEGFPAFCVVDAERVVLAGGLTTEGLEFPATV